MPNPQYVRLLASDCNQLSVLRRFIDNVASSNGGGAVYVSDLRSMVVSNVTFRGNTAGKGGGALETVRSDAMTNPNASVMRTSTTATLPCAGENDSAVHRGHGI